MIPEEFPAYLQLHRRDRKAIHNNDGLWDYPAYLYLHRVGCEQEQSGGDGTGIKPEESGFAPVLEKCQWHDVCSLWKRELPPDTIATSHVMTLPNMTGVAAWAKFQPLPMELLRASSGGGLEATSDAEKKTMTQEFDDSRDTVFRTASRFLLDMNSAREEQGRIFPETHYTQIEPLNERFTDESVCEEFPENLLEESLQNRLLGLARMLVCGEKCSSAHPKKIWLKKPRAEITVVIMQCVSLSGCPLSPDPDVTYFFGNTPLIGELCGFALIPRYIVAHGPGPCDFPPDEKEI